jgi:hypothetical protein
MDLNELASSLDAFEQVDVSDFQRRARILQSMWRKQQGYPVGEHRRGSTSRPLGSRLPMPWAEQSLANFITDNIREVVRSEVCDADLSKGKLYGKPRIFNDLLSSQPLCFNLFAELRGDLDLASSVVNKLTDGRFSEVRAILFEHSPGRKDGRYLGDRSAFDVFLKCATSSGGNGFIGIEVKYHENLRGPASEHRKRYDEVAEQMGCFAQEAKQALKSSPLQQIWRDHLLTGVTRSVDGYDDALFVMLYPQDNGHVSDAITAYRACLTNAESFAGWTLEEFLHRMQMKSKAEWIALFVDRYLAFGKIDEQLGGAD